jgi:hypothetical protein
LPGGSRGLGDVYKRQVNGPISNAELLGVGNASNKV